MKPVLATFLSRKFLATFFALLVVVWFHLHTENVLERIDVQKAGHLATIFMATGGTIAAILIGYLGFNTLQTKFGLSGVAQVLANTSSEKREENIEVNETIIQKFAEEYKADPSYVPPGRLPDMDVENFKDK